MGAAVDADCPPKPPAAAAPVPNEFALAAPNVFAGAAAPAGVVGAPNVAPPPPPPKLGVLGGAVDAAAAPNWNEPPPAAGVAGAVADAAEF